MLPKYLHRFENALQSVSRSVEQASISSLEDYQVEQELSLTAYSTYKHEFIIDMYSTSCDSLLVVISTHSHSDACMHKLPYKPIPQVIDSLRSYFQLSPDEQSFIHTKF
jgi:hypothetical protein